MKGNIIRQIVTGILLTSGLFGAGQVFSIPNESSASNVNLIATINNGPAMQPVVWTLYRLDNLSTRPQTIRRHSAALNLQPGRYRAVANLHNVTRYREFNVTARTTNDVVIAMD